MDASEQDLPTIKLVSRLDLPAAEALSAELLSMRDGVPRLCIDAEEVSLVDTPAIQVLLAAAQDQAARGGRLEMKAPSAAIVEAMDLLGLNDELNAWRGANG